MHRPAGVIRQVFLCKDLRQHHTKSASRLSTALLNPRYDLCEVLPISYPPFPKPFQGCSERHNPVVFSVNHPPRTKDIRYDTGDKFIEHGLFHPRSESSYRQILILFPSSHTGYSSGSHIPERSYRNSRPSEH